MKTFSKLFYRKKKSRVEKKGPEKNISNLYRRKPSNALDFAQDETMKEYFVGKINITANLSPR
jgi:hypothetical protein